MLGFTPFASAPFSSTGEGAIVNIKANFYATATVTANVIAYWYNGANILGESTLNADSNIVGSGWVRQNPDTPEWDMTQSQDWNTIK